MSPLMQMVLVAGQHAIQGLKCFGLEVLVFGEAVEGYLCRIVVFMGEPMCPPFFGC